MMNEEQHFAGAIHYAKSLLERSELTEDEQRIELAYESITSHLPDDETLQQLRAAREGFLELYANDQAAAQAMFSDSRDPEIATIDDAERQVELASWAMLVHSLLNLDITKTRE